MTDLLTNYMFTLQLSQIVEVEVKWMSMLKEFSAFWVAPLGHTIAYKNIDIFC